MNLRYARGHDMTLQAITHKQADALAAFLHELRPDWDVPGIVAILGTSRGKAAAGELAVAAIRAAADPANRTPAVIGMDGKHWRGDAPQAKTGAIRNTKCNRCRWFHAPGVECEPFHPAQADIAEAAKAAAREAIERALPPPDRTKKVDA